MTNADTNEHMNGRSDPLCATQESGVPKGLSWRNGVHFSIPLRLKETGAYVPIIKKYMFLPQKSKESLWVFPAQNIVF